MSALSRAGKLVLQPDGFSAFVPADLPPNPPIKVDGELLRLLSRADVALGRLDGIANVIPDPDFFVAMYVRREAVLSSQIEGTQSTLEDLLQAELADESVVGDVADIVNYVSAMNYGLSRIQKLPLSLRLIREIHAHLMHDGRGSQATPGEFRTSQNWIGPQGASLSRATFVPPPVHDMKAALHNFEGFLHDTNNGPVLLDAGVAHAQFETIHPFVDGNGRIGRLLITFLMVHRGVLRRPLLYLSHFFKLNRAEYYDRLTAVRLSGDWEGWLRFFVRGVAETAEDATATAERIFRLREDLRASLLIDGVGQNGLPLLSFLFLRPIVTVNTVAEGINVSYPTANNLMTKFLEMGLVSETTGRKRRRNFRFDPYLELFDEPEIEIHGEIEQTKGL